MFVSQRRAGQERAHRTLNLLPHTTTSDFMMIPQSWLYCKYLHYESSKFLKAGFCCGRFFFFFRVLAIKHLPAQGSKCQDDYWN